MATPSTDHKLAADEARRGMQYGTVKAQVEDDVNAEIAERAAVAAPTEEARLDRHAREHADHLAQLGTGPLEHAGLEEGEHLAHRVRPRARQREQRDEHPGRDRQDPLDHGAASIRIGLMIANGVTPTVRSMTRGATR